MTLILPAPHHLQRVDWDVDALNRGETNGGSLTHNTKSAGSLPVNASNATASTNNTGSNATGNPAFAHHGLLSSGGYDVSGDTKLLIFSYQCNAANRIQVSTLANDGFCFRVGSGGGSPPTNYKHYQIGGRDTPLGRQNAGIRAVIIDLNDTSNESGGGTFDNTNVQTYALGTVRHNISGSSSNWYFRQPTFLFDTQKNAANIPTFTGLNSNFNEFIDAVLGNDFSDIVGYDWVSRNGDILNIASPMQIGDGVTATTFDGQGVTVISPGSDDPSDPRNRLTTQAMRVYWEPRNNAADTLDLTGVTMIWGTAAPFDLDVSNAAVATLTGGTFRGMGDFTVGSSVSGAALFNLASGSSVRINGANLDNSTINGSLDILGSSVTTLTGLSVSGTVTFDTAGTYSIVGGSISEVVNTSGGAVILDLSGGAQVTTNTGPNITINDNRVHTITGIIPASQIIIYDKDSADPQDLGTELQRNASSGITEVYSYPINKVGDDIVVRMVASGYRPLIKTIQLPSGDAQTQLDPEPETN